MKKFINQTTAIEDYDIECNCCDKISRDSSLNNVNQDMQK